MKKRFCLPLMATILVLACRQRSPTTGANEASGKPGGIYGFSGAGTPEGSPEGVIGECVWIFDADNRTQVAKGECAPEDPGNFRLALKPGHYVLHGPGGNQKLHIRAGKWVKISSVASLPMMP
ncbi:MAG: hypothetical protein ACREQT_07885 [Candidatus Binataceae bacterium]